MASSESAGRHGDPRLSQVRRNDESWVEIASQPSSSSLSSIGDEIVTTGLRVSGGNGMRTSQSRRRRLLQQQQQAARMPTSSLVTPPSMHQAGTSSQEEYEETESDDDRVMSSSAENIRQSPVAPAMPIERTAIGPGAVMELDTSEDDDDDDDDDNGTALGRPSASPPNFRPQPNAFSHPPHHLQHRSHSTNSSVPPHPSSFHRPSMSQRSQTRVPRRGPNFMSPSYHEENDAALRASLTTLLSCAAAARSLPKKDDTIAGPSALSTGIRPSTQPMDLRLVPEQDLLAGPTPPSRQPQARTASNSSAPSGPSSNASRETAEKTKRAAAAAVPAKSSRATKKKRTSSVSGPSAAMDGGDAALLASPSFPSPTLLTWVVGAGVVVLVSVVGFGAGYVIGREVGRQEASLGLDLSGGASAVVGNSSSCGREIARSTSGGTLRRFKWGAGVARSAVA